MWERQYEHGRWNGHKLNILSTAIDGGQRLQVSDIPYAQLPHVKIMGSKSRNFNLEVVFVGANSLADANAFISNLESSPTGELEHPWLGELPLVFETFSQSISTKRGLVILSLTFVRAGVPPTITARTKVRTKEQASIVESLSSQSFSKDIKSMSVSEINQTQDRFTQAINVLVDITNRLNLADDILQKVSHSINEAFSAVSGLSQEPETFTNLFSTAVSDVADGVQAEPASASEAVDRSRNTQALMLKQVKDDSPTNHYNVQMVTGAIKMSKDLSELEKVDHFNVITTSKQPVIMQGDLSALVVGVDERINEATKVSTMESMALYDSLVLLKGNVQIQHDKVVAGKLPHRTVRAPRFKPALVVAHDEHTSEKVITAINTLQHPLFMRGDILVRDMSAGDAE